MRKLLFLLLLLPCLVKAQPGKHLLKGSARTPEQGSMPYLVSITITGSKVTGYSITDYTNNSMKATVVGSVDAKGNLRIQETGSLDGPSVANMTYLYFTANLRVSVHEGKKVYTGPFISRNVAGEIKDQGTMMLMDMTPPPANLKQVGLTKPPATVKPKPKPEPKPEPKPKPKPPVADTVKPKPKPKPPVVATDTVKPKLPVVVADTPKLKPEMVTAPPIDTTSYYPLYHWASDSVRFEIWDGYKQDGDGVGITFNGRQLAEYLVLSNSKSYFSVPIERGVINELRIDLRNEGTEPPNTPYLTLHDGEHEIPLSISGKEGTKASLYFIKP